MCAFGGMGAEEMVGGTGKVLRRFRRVGSGGSMGGRRSEGLIKRFSVNFLRILISFNIEYWLTFRLQMITYNPLLTLKLASEGESYSKVLCLYVIMRLC